MSKKSKFEDKARKIALPYVVEALDLPGFAEKYGRQEHVLPKDILEAYKLYLDKQLNAISLAAYAYHIGRGNKNGGIKNG